MFNSLQKKSAETENSRPENPQSDTDTLEQLYKQYHHLVLGICLKYLKNREDARDAVTEICQKLTVESQKQEIHSFKSWLYIVTRNHCYEKLRKKKKQTFVSLEEATNNTIFMEFPDFQHHNNGHCTDENIYQAISKLKKGQCQCVTLFYLEERSYKEVAEITGYDLKKVKSHIQNGRQNLKKILIQMAEKEYAR